MPKVYLKEFSKDKSGHFFAAVPRPDYLRSINSRHVEQVCYVDNFIGRIKAQFLSDKDYPDEMYKHGLVDTARGNNFLSMKQSG